jgi:hypothetical protein
VLVALRRVPVPDRLPLPDGGTYELPDYDRRALAIETDLLLDWYWPATKGSPVPDDVRSQFRSLWDDAFEGLAEMPRGWLLRDFHSPNLMWLPERQGIARVGLLDFQDALRGPWAYDLVSLLQDARLDVPATLEVHLFEHYCREVGRAESDFDRQAFALAYAALGAQRNTKILGIFARLARRDGKPQYLRHNPRIWGYLARDLEHPALAALAQWYDCHFQPSLRANAPAV